MSTSTSTTRKATRTTPSADKALNTGRTKRADKAPATKRAIQLTATQRKLAAELTTAIVEAEQLGVSVLKLIIRARSLKMPADSLRDVVKAAYLKAGNSPESARKRGADAITVFESKAKAADLPGNLQRAAGKIRSDRKPAAKKGAKPPVAKVNAKASPLATLEASIEAIAKSTEDADILAIVASMRDLTNDLADLMAESKQA